jgi:two-component system, chemotaxis family, CheB/CheR fusion protein
LARKKSAASYSSTSKGKRGRRRPPTRLKKRTSGPKRHESVAAEKRSHESQTDHTGKNSFPIVGIGASAGGLEAFTELLKHLPADTGMGFVLVQHLDPDHESALTKILTKATSMPVRDVANNLTVEADHVYVIPPNKTLSIAQGVLKLKPRKQTRTPTRSIDSFLESLAQDQREQAIGVILSGTATDGTVGLEAIKAEGGIAFAQDDSAKYDSMPRSAVAAGCVDFVLSPAEIAKELARIAKHPYVAGQPLELSSPEEDRAAATAHEDDETALPSGGLGAPATGAKRARAEARYAGVPPAPDTEEARATPAYQNGFKKILLLLRNHSGVDFSLYKSNTIQRRITRRVVLNKQESLDEYANFLRGNTKELDALYSDTLISVTSFFRNPEAFEVLKSKVFPTLVERRGDDPFRIWVLGCSTGQEAYSLAMAFIESADKAPRLRKLQVFATDLNDVLLEKARHGLYAKSLAEDVSPARLRRFFVEEEGGYRIVKSLREMVVFARQNLITDPPFSRLDLISCRNLLIYLEPTLQKKALPTFHYALKPHGFLFLGASESIGAFTDLFEPVDKKHKVYSRKDTTTPIFHLPEKKDRAERNLQGQTLRPPLPAISQDEQPQGLRSELSAQREADRMTVNRFAPPSVLINADMQILQFRGPTGGYLQPPTTGKATFDVLKMAREGLMLPLRTAINQAKKNNQTARRENVSVDRNGSTRTVNIEVVPLKNLRDRCYLILFEEADKGGGYAGVPLAIDEATALEKHPRSTKTKKTAGGTPAYQISRTAELENELSETRDYLQSIQEQHEAANEELQASNEEVQSANEELQSLNEELETSKEELESTNEELTTVNEEMANRNAELNRLNADLTNLQTSTKLPIVLLGRDLAIRRFSAQAERQFNLVATDVGRPISIARHNLDVADLEAFIGEVITNVRESEREVRDTDGRWYSLRVRPYMSLDNKVDGAVVVLLDISALKQTEAEIRDARDYAEAIIETVREPLIVLDEGLRVQTANHAFYEKFQVSPDKTQNRLLYELGNRQWDIPRLRTLLQEILPNNNQFHDFEVEHEFQQIGQRTMLLDARRLASDSRRAPLILLAIEDISERRRAEEAARKFASIVESTDAAIISKDLTGVITSWNRGAESLFGYTAEEAIGQPVTMLIPAERFDEEPGILARIRRGERIEHYETIRRHKDGSTMDISLTVSPIVDNHGHVVGASKLARDVSQRKQAEKERELSLAREQEAREQADQANRIKDEFLATVSHELRTPLNAILGWSHMLMRGTLDEETTRRALDTIARNAAAQNQLISDLLDVSRIISGQLRFQKRAVDLIPVINAAADTVRLAADAKRLELSLKLDSSAGMISGDAARLQQIVSNLLTNAVKFTSRSGRVDVQLKRQDTSVLITVADTGEGISPDFLPYVFDRFRQAEGTSARQHGGLGLGLAIVRHLVELHGGTIRAASDGVGKGATFTAVFPIIAVTEDEGDVKTGSTKGSLDEDSHLPLKGVRVLVVDDEPDARELLTIALAYGGAEVKASTTAREALDVLDQWNPDVLVSDIGMPGQDGYELIRKVRVLERESSRTIPAIALTGYASNDDAARARKAGYDLHIPKPVSPRELVATVANLVTGTTSAL